MKADSWKSTDVILFPGLVTIFLVGLVLRMPTELAVHPDTVRDILQAREFLGSFPPRLVGPISSFANLHQGSLWYLYLELLESFGLSITGIRWVTLILTLAGLTATILATRAIFGRLESAIAGAAAFLLMTGNPGLIDTLWNPVIVLLPASLATAWLARAASGNNLRTWLVAAGLLSLVVQLHVAAAALLLPALVVLLLYGPRPRWRSTLVCTASFVFCYALLSPHALWLNLQAIVSLSDLPSTWTLQVLDSNNYIALALLVPVSIVLVRAGPRHKDRPQASRALLLFTGTGLIMMMGGAILMRRQLEPRYLAPLLPGMAMLAAGTTGRLIRLAYVMLPAPVHKALGGSAVHVSLLLALSLPAALAPGLRTPLHRNDPNIRNNLTFADVEAVANVLPDLGINTWPEALQYLRSPTAGDLLIGLSLHFPIPTSQLLIPNSQHPLPNSQFVLRLPPDSLTNIRADRVTVARKGGLGPLVLISVPDPFDWSRFAGAIPERHQPAPAPVPVHLALSPEASFGYPLLAGWSAPDRPVGWRLKVTAGPSDTDLVIVPLCPAYSHDCKASVTDEKTASGPEYLLKAGAVENLSFSWDFAFLAQHQAGLLPPILCFPSDEPGFREIIEALRPL